MNMYTNIKITINSKNQNQAEEENKAIDLIPGLFFDGMCNNK